MLKNTSSMEMSQQSTHATTKNKPYSIMVTGATGFIGIRLISHLSKLGYCIKGMSRQKISDTLNIKYVKADVFDVTQLENSLTEIEVAYYLLHSMEGSKIIGRNLHHVKKSKLRISLKQQQKQE